LFFNHDVIEANEIDGIYYHIQGIMVKKTNVYMIVVPAIFEWLCNLKREPGTNSPGMHSQVEPAETVNEQLITIHRRSV